MKGIINRFRPQAGQSYFSDSTKFEAFLRGFQRKNPSGTAKIPSRSDNKALLCRMGFSQVTVTPSRGREQ